MTTTAKNLADYIIFKTAEDNRALNLLKLQKLMFYVQAWHLAHHGTRLFPGAFEAWVHGPVNREIYERFREQLLYGAVTVDDITQGFSPESIPEADRDFIDGVLDAYAGFSGSQLEELTHREQPWQKARVGFSPIERCDRVIADDVMRDFYGQRIKSSLPATS